MSERKNQAITDPFGADPMSEDLAPHGCDHIPGNYPNSPVPLGAVYTLPEVAQAVGIDYRTAYNWLKRGILCASVKQAEGSGSASSFSPADLERAHNAAGLRRAGVEASRLEQLGDALAEPNRWSLVIGRLTAPRQAKAGA